MSALRSSRLTIVAMAATLLSTAGCTERDLVTGPDIPPANLAIYDGPRGGNAAFFFLAPLVRSPAFSGTFDGTRSPEVEVCSLVGTACGGVVARFTGSQVKVDLQDEAYLALWKTRDAGLDPATTYRIRVLLGTQVLGFADLVVVDNGRQIRTVDGSEFATAINGGALPIRFRIEEGAVVPPPPPGRWQPGDLTTYLQVDWTTDPTAVAMLESSFSSVYAPSEVVEIGIPGTAGFSLRFSSVTSIKDYLPQLFGFGPLNADLVNPTSSSSGGFGGEVLALRLNIDFSDAGVTMGSAGIAFGDLTLCGLGTTPSLDGLTVRAFSAIVNTALGGGTTANSIAVLNPIIRELNSSFGGGGVGLFAQNHLFNGPCPGSSGWNDGDLRTYAQFDWGGDSATNSGAALLEGSYGAVYGALFEVGIPGTAGFSMIFTSYPSLVLYLPSSGPAGILTSDLLNPTSSPAGAFAGHLAALKLNVDFSDAGLTPRSGVAFGDVRICNVATPTGVNNMTVRQLLSSASTLLGGGSSTFTAATLAPFIESLNESFLGGVSTFARDHLVNGPCPWSGG